MDNETKTMFRTEVCYGEGYRNPIGVMCHETFEYLNTDILDTLIDGLLKDHPIRSKLQEMLEYIEDGNEDEIEEDDERAIAFYTEVLDAIFEVTGKRITYCLWLASKEAVIEYYGDGNLDEDDIDEYPISDVILSDLGEEGILFGYEKPVYEL